MRRRALLLVAALVALSASAADGRKYAVLSLIGDEIMLSGAQQKTGARLDQNARRFIEVTDPFADKAALLAVHEALKEKPGAEPVLLFGRDRRLYQAQARLLESGEGMQKLLADIRPLLGTSGATHLILITKDRREARIQLEREALGHGTLQGIGYYVDLETPILLTSGESALGFVAAFAYFNASLIRLDTGQPIAEQRINASRAMATPSHKNIEDIWGGMSPADRVRMIRELVAREVRAMVPKLLSESDR
jgi:hypothetical protein